MIKFRLTAADIVAGLITGVCLSVVIGITVWAWSGDDNPLPDLPAIPNPPAAHPEPEGEPMFAYVDEAAAPPPAIEIRRKGNTLIDITIYGEAGRPLVVIHPSGSIALKGSTDEAAMAFWRAVSIHRPKCELLH